MSIVENLQVLWPNKFHVARGNAVDLGNAFVRKTSITVRGTGNRIKIESGLTRITDCHITICHSNSSILIKSKSNLNHCNLYIEDDGGKLSSAHMLRQQVRHISLLLKVNP